jgi:diamine N-acetyltransferase
MSPLIGNSIALRAMEPSDLELLYQWENDPEVWIVSNTQIPYSKYLLKNFIDNAGQDIYSSKQLRLMIVEITSGKTVGIIDIFDFDPFHQRAGVGILIDKKSRNHGYASESICLVKNYAFDVLLIHQLYCNILEDNEISLKLFLNNGFSVSGRCNEWIKTKDGFKDEFFLQCFNNLRK